MDEALLAARLLLAGVLGMAAVGKLIDRKGGRTALAEFGVPPALTAPLAALLPAVELATALALLWRASARAGAFAALALLVLFTAAITINLRAGHRPDCHCFGQVSSDPVGWSSVVRNVLLCGVAAFVAVAGPDSLSGGTWGWLTGLDAPALAGLFGGLALTAVLALQWWAIVNLMRQNGRLLARVETLEDRGGLRGSPGLPLGADAPEVVLTERTGERVSLRSLTVERTGKALVLVFSSPGCGPCLELLPELAGWQSEHEGAVTIAIITRPSDNGGPSEVERPFHHVLLQQEYEAMEAFGAPGTPSAVILTRDGTIGSQVAVGAEAIRALLRQALEPEELAAASA
jgi:thiol-disulfide isomerase/thioredoxin